MKHRRKAPNIIDDRKTWHKSVNMMTSPRLQSPHGSLGQRERFISTRDSAVPMRQATRQVTRSSLVNVVVPLEEPTDVRRLRSSASNDSEQPHGNDDFDDG